jgi:hypothetical protein
MRQARDTSDKDRTRDQVGPWLPTCYLRWYGAVLQQKLRRRIKVHPTRGDGSPAYHYYEFEWQKVKDWGE